MPKKSLKSPISMFLIGFAALSLFTESLMAQSGAVINKSTTKVSKNSKAKETSKTDLEFSLTSINYAEASEVDTSSLVQAEARLKMQSEGSSFSGIDITLGTFSEANSFYYFLPEAYLGFGSATQNVFLGRKHENLSFADDFFNLGLIQSTGSNDFINFSQGGLTGVSGHINAGGFGFMASFNPIFIPNQDPQVKFEDGEVISSNRWAARPPAQFKFGSDYKDINYAFSEYDIGKIVSHSGFMGRFYIGPNNNRPYFGITYADKPMNQVAVARDTYSDISTFEGYVLIRPTVLYHQVVAADVNIDFNNFKSTLSYLSDQPRNETAEELEYLQNLNPLQIYSAYAALDFSDFVGKKLSVYSAIAFIDGGEIKDLNSSGQVSSIAIANSRTRFKQPFKIGVNSELFFIYNEALEADVALTYDQVYRGSLMSVNLKYAPSKKLKFNAGVDLIGVESDLAADAQGNFLDQNKANDRFSAGMSYVF